MGFLAGKRLVITGAAVEPLDRLWHRPRLPPRGGRAGLQLRGRALPRAHRRFRARVRQRTGLRLRCRRRRPDRRACSSSWARAWPQFDGFVHSIGFAPREAIAGDFLDGLSREAFRIAHDISAYSFPAHGQGRPAPPARGQFAADPDLPGRRARACPTTTPWAWPRPRWKPACATWRGSLGPKGVRVNGISAGPIRTLAASGIKDFGKLLDVVAKTAPLRRNITIDDVGNVAAFLLSDLAAGITRRDHLRGRRLQPGGAGRRRRQPAQPDARRSQRSGARNRRSSGARRRRRLPRPGRARRCRSRGTRR